MTELQTGPGVGRADEDLARIEDLLQDALGVGVAVLGRTDTAVSVPEPLRADALVHLTGDAVLIGPWGDSADPGCGQCLGIRWQRLRTRSEREALEHGRDPEPIGRWPVLPAFVLDLVQAHLDQLHAGARIPYGSPWATQWRTAPDDNLMQVTRIELDTLRTRTFALLREPSCPTCGPSRSEEEAAVVGTSSRPKQHAEDARARTLAQVPLPFNALANPVAGALGPGTWLNHLSPTTAPVASGVFVRGYAGLVDVTFSGQGEGYGRSRELAFLEGLERYAGTHQRHAGDVVHATWAQVRSHAIHPLSCGDYEPSTYVEESLLEPYTEDRTIPWVWGRSLRDRRDVLVPARLVYYSAGIDDDNFVFECSNGCATGSSVEEAALYGVLELLERDAFLLGWYGGAELPALDLDDLADPEVEAMRARAALLGYEVFAFDNRIDIDVPVVTTVAVRPDGALGRASFAAGAGLRPQDALRAALSESLTYLPHLGSQVRESEAELRRMMTNYAEVRRLTDHARLFGLPEMGEHIRRYTQPRRSVTLGEAYQDADPLIDVDQQVELSRVVERVAAAGHDVIVVDQTTPEERAMGLNTVATLAPGLLPIDFGWNRQRALRMPRLRTALRRAGLRDKDLGPDDLVRVPHPFP